MEEIRSRFEAITSLLRVKRKLLSPIKKPLLEEDYKTIVDHLSGYLTESRMKKVWPDYAKEIKKDPTNTRHLFESLLTHLKEVDPNEDTVSLIDRRINDLRLQPKLKIFKKIPAQF